jgi:hypothetical protein
MITPIHCPFCGDVLLTTYKGDSVLLKTCDRRIGHEISYFANVPTDTVYKVKIRIDGTPVKYVTWVFTKKELFLIARTGQSNITYLPYFEPDLTNYNKLVDKIRTYILFS